MRVGHSAVHGSGIRGWKGLFFIVGSALLSPAALATSPDEPVVAPEEIPPYATASWQESLAASPAAAAAPSRTVEVKIEDGDTLYAVLGRAGVGAAGRMPVINAVKDVFDPKTLRPGDAVRLVIEERRGEAIVHTLHLETGSAEDLTVYVAAGKARRGGGTKPAIRQVSGAVGDDFRQSLLDADLPAALVEKVLLAMVNDPDAPAAPTASGRFRIGYEAASAEAPPGREAEICFIELDDGEKVHRVYRYEIGRTATAFVQPNGKGVAVIDFLPPLRDAEMTSPFGWRIHPVFGDRRFHKGVDFRAPKGTPVAASADGVVVEVGWRGNYGKMVRVRHQASVETTYAHLSGFAKGLKPGKTVKQGQIVGYVGRTGVATGHHLYFELVVNGRHVDPMAPPPVFPVRLDGDQLSALHSHIRNAATN